MIRFRGFRPTALPLPNIAMVRFVCLVAAVLALASGNPRSEASEQDRKPTPVFEEHPLFQAKEAGYHCYRIPALLVTKQGTVLAFAEARKNNCYDHGDVDLVLKRSSDGGRTWSAQQLVADGDSQTMGNPCPVQDRETCTIEQRKRKAERCPV